MEHKDRANKPKLRRRLANPLLLHRHHPVKQHLPHLLRRAALRRLLRLRPALLQAPEAIARYARKPTSDFELDTDRKSIGPAAAWTVSG